MCKKNNPVSSIANGTSNGWSFDSTTLRNVNGDLISFSMTWLDPNIDFRDAMESVVIL